MSSMRNLIDLAVLGALVATGLILLEAAGVAQIGDVWYFAAGGMAGFLRNLEGE